MQRCHDQGVTMPEPDDTPRLAEIARTIADFRSEFREAISGMVRRDVYMAEMRTLEVKIEALVNEDRRIENNINSDLKTLYQEIEKDRSDRKGVRTQVLGASLAAAVSIIMLIIQVVVVK